MITDINGNILHKIQTRNEMHEGRERVLEKTFRFIRQAIQESGLAPIAIKGIGIAHSGVIDSEEGMVLSYPRPGQMAEWKNVPSDKYSKKELNVSSLGDEASALGASRLITQKILDDLYAHWQRSAV